MTDRVPEPVNSEPQDRFLVKTFGMIGGWAKPTGRAKCPPDDKGHGARAPLPTLRGCAVVAGLALLGAASPASAQGKLDARYEVTLAGIPVGKGSWVVDIADDQYSASASGGTSGLLKAFASGFGTGGSQGRIVNGALIPQAYSATVQSIPTASWSPTRIAAASTIR